MIARNRSIPVLLMAAGFQLATAPVMGQGSGQNTTASIEEIVITAQAVPRPRLETIQAATVLTGDRFADAVRSSLGETLRDVPGVSATSFGLVASRPIIRGFDADRVKTLSGGLAIVDASAISPDHQVALDFAPARRIEVLRGPSTLMFGNGATGGVVNVEDGRIAVALPDRTATGRLHGSYGTGADEGTIGGWTKLAVGNGLVLHADGTTRANRDYKIKGFAGGDAELANVEGLVPNSDGAGDAWAIGSSFVGDHGFFGVSVARMTSEYGSPAEPGLFPEEPGEDPAPVRLDVEQTKYDVRGEWRASNGLIDRASFAAVIGNYSHTEFEGDETGTIFDSDGWESRVEFQQAAIGNLNGLFGVQAKRRKLAADGAEAFLPPTKTTQWAPFVLQDWKSGPWAVQAGARFERTRVSDTSSRRSRAFSSFAGSIAVDREVADRTYIGALTGWSERAPTVEELFANGPHLATNQFEIGDANLAQEKTFNAEISARIARGSLTASASAFRSSISNFILARQMPEFEDGLPVFMFTAVDARFQGAEIEAELSLIETKDLSVSGYTGVSLVRATARDSGERLPRIPPAEFKIGAEFRIRDVTARAETVGALRQRRIAPLETPTSGYEFFNAEIATRIGVARPMRIALQGRNLTNARGLPHSSFIKELAPLPGRDVRFTVSSEF